MLPFAFSQTGGYNETVSFFIGSIRQIWVQMSNKYYLFTNQLTEEEHRVIVSIVTVSYTHLDVYKRQPVDGKRQGRCKGQ